LRTFFQNDRADIIHEAIILGLQGVGLKDE